MSAESMCSFKGDDEEGQSNVAAFERYLNFNDGELEITISLDAALSSRIPIFLISC